jgi:hypothetical protein
MSEQVQQPVKRGRGRPPKLPRPGERRTARLTLTAGELERLRQAVEALRRAGEAGLSQADFTRRAVLAEVDRVLGAASARRPGKGQAADLPPAQDKPARRKPPRPRGG